MSVLHRISPPLTALCCAVFLGSLLVGAWVPTSGAETRSWDPPLNVRDTLYLEADAGETVIYTLPDSLGDAPASAYSGLQLPALSMVADRSFMWRTTSEEQGTHLLLFRVSEPAGVADTLWVRVSLQ